MTPPKQVDVNDGAEYSLATCQVDGSAVAFKDLVFHDTMSADLGLHGLDNAHALKDPVFNAGIGQWPLKNGRALSEASCPEVQLALSTLQHAQLCLGQAKARHHDQLVLHFAFGFWSLVSAGADSDDLQEHLGEFDNVWHGKYCCLQSPFFL